MTHGGKRHGAGRHPGTPNKASARLVHAIAQTGLTPIEIMVGVMRCTFDSAARAQAKKNLTKESLNGPSNSHLSRHIEQHHSRTRACRLSSPSPVRSSTIKG
jgi:hypothetical protein